MNKKSLLIAGVLVVVLAVIAISIVTRPDSAATKAPTSAGKELLFPDLYDQLNDVSKVVLKDASQTITLVRQEDGWGVAEKGGFPIQFTNLRDMLVKIAGMKKVEAKTSDPARYGEIQVKDVDAEDSDSKLVRVYTSGDEPVAALVAGKNDFSRGSEAHQFVRLEGNKQSWLVEGNIAVNASASNWLDRQILNIASTRPRYVEVLRADGDMVKAERTSPDVTGFELLNKPEDRELKSEYVTGEFARMFASLRVDDVVRLSELDVPEEELALARVMTFDGLTIESKVYNLEGKNYAVFSASVDKDAIQRENDRRAEAARAIAEDAETAAPEPELVDAEEITKEADAFNKKVDGWAFAVPQYIADRLTRNLEFYLKEPVTEETAGDGQGEILMPDTQELLELIPPELPSMPDVEATTETSYE